MAKSTPTSQAGFEARLDRDRPDVAATAREIILWARDRRLRLRWTSASELDSGVAYYELGAVEHKIFTLETGGLVWVIFDQLASRLPIKDSAAKQGFVETLRARLLDLPKADHNATATGTQAGFRLEDLQSSGRTSEFLGILDWVIDEITRNFDALLAEQRRRRG